MVISAQFLNVSCGPQPGPLLPSEQVPQLLAAIVELIKDYKNDQKTILNGTNLLHKSNGEHNVDILDCLELEFGVRKFVDQKMASRNDRFHWKS